jgi:hypothetical protein
MPVNEAEREAVVDTALTMADAEARWRDYDYALKWLDAAEAQGGELPPEYATKRLAWQELLAGARARTLSGDLDLLTRVHGG